MPYVTKTVSIASIFMLTTILSMAPLSAQANDTPLTDYAKAAAQMALDELGDSTATVIGMSVTEQSIDLRNSTFTNDASGVFNTIEIQGKIGGIVAKQVFEGVGLQAKNGSSIIVNEIAVKDATIGFLKSDQIANFKKVTVADGSYIIANRLRYSSK